MTNQLDRQQLLIMTAGASPIGGKIIQTLLVNGQTTGLRLMLAVGLPRSREPVTSFVTLVHALNAIDRKLAPHGWRCRRSGGTPQDYVWLEEMKGG